MSVKTARWWFFGEAAVTIFLLVPLASALPFPLLLWWWLRWGSRRWHGAWLPMVALVLGWQIDVLRGVGLGLGPMFAAWPLLVAWMVRRLTKYWQRESFAFVNALLWLAGMLVWWRWPLSLWWQQAAIIGVVELLLLLRTYAVVKK